MKLDIYQVDAFSSKPFAGNPAAVVPLDAWLPAETMLAIAAENNLAETAFFVQSPDGFDLKWFTPAVEIDLCGHATLASAFVLYELLGYSEPALKFRTRSGDLSVTPEGGRYVLNFPSRPAVKTDAPAGLIEAIGVAPAEISKARDYLLVYESEADIRAIKPDLFALSNVDAHAVIVTAQGETADFVSRFFAPSVGVPEDPVTGSAHCTLIPYWAERLGKNELFARQVSARGGELYCELAGDRVKIGGEAALYMKGEIYVGVGSEKSVAA
ncbi:MAG TPA: PhzF family phenazine biosynthesis protein [Pyrinomonadaceae bacterium]|nr:PhzF family phenazine biosynthesis protein [Pyrinomonadaceae bacterium]